jgi:Dolichyl-phosphate-mannose-protein mannosyltransferase
MLDGLARFRGKIPIGGANERAARREPRSPGIVSWVVLASVSAVLIAFNTDFLAPPRFDGAGYAVLGDALATGRGYHEIDKPDAPRHAHFPPGYPGALALVWLSAGRSVAAAHVFSLLCTVAAVLLAWRWFCTIYPSRPAFLLGLALAVNWSWGRGGGSIQSEPLYLVWEMFVVLIVVKARRRDRFATGIVLGVALAACALIRHVGLCFAAAAIIDLALRRQWRALRTALPVAVLLILPWVIWLSAVRTNTQVGYLAQKSIIGRIPGQVVFYVQRLPDQITGPFVEVATVFGRSPKIAVFANLWAAAATGIIVWGWVSTLRTPRLRLAGLAALITLAILLIWPFTEAGRFLFPIVPFLLVGATEGLARISAFLKLRRPRVWACGIVLALSVPYAVYAVATGRAHAGRLTHADFDAACQWIDQNATRPGPVLTRHPGEVFWQTGRQAVAPDSAGDEAVDQLVDRLGASYLLIDEDRFANESSSPLSGYVIRHPDRVSRVWSRNRGTASIRIFEVLPPR